MSSTRPPLVTRAVSAALRQLAIGEKTDLKRIGFVVKRHPLFCQCPARTGCVLPGNSVKGFRFTMF